MTPNLPPHLQESIEEKFRIKCFSGSEWHHNSQTAITISKHSNSYLLELEGYISGYRQAYADILQELGPVVNAISFYVDMDSWSENKQKESIYDVIDKDDLGVGDFEQSCGPNHVLNSISDSNNGGRMARESLKHLKERILNVE